MYFVTNRAIRNRSGLDILGNRPHAKGPNELHLFHAKKVNRKWTITQVGDKVDKGMLADINKLEDKAEHIISNSGPDRYASWYVAKQLFYGLRESKKNLVFFVHGFNTNVKDMLDRADRFQSKYGVEVVSFSWPSNGGGVKGVPYYLSDKADARASEGALNNCLKKIAAYLNEFNESFLELMRQKLEKKWQIKGEGKGIKGEDEAKQVLRMLEQSGCPFSVNLVCHSMGNYLYKRTFSSSEHYGNRLMFDNVVLVSADTNNPGHESWVDEIKCRRQVYITINENDYALNLSEKKWGKEQKERLGNYRHNLCSNQAIYVDFTDLKEVDNSHAYFEGDALKNLKVKKFFKEALNGKRAEVGLYYNADSNLYRFSGRQGR